MIDIVVGYIDRSSPITLGVLGLLSFYLFISVWVFVYRYLTLSRMTGRERDSLEQMQMGATKVTQTSILSRCLKKSPKPTDKLLKVCEYAATREVTKGLTILSIIASTSPFIGLFGTVISILEAFSGLGVQKNATLGVVAPAISEALVATAAGIFVAIFAYTFHLLLKRKAYEFTTIVLMEADLMLALKEDH